MIKDEVPLIQQQVRAWVNDPNIDVIITNGGTGITGRDVTPEATRSVMEREVPGLAELMRAEGVKRTRRAALSRGLVGVRKGKLIVNLPGSERGARESLDADAAKCAFLGLGRRIGQRSVHRQHQDGRDDAGRRPQEEDTVMTPLVHDQATVQRP